MPVETAAKEGLAAAAGNAAKGRRAFRAVLDTVLVVLLGWSTLNPIVTALAPKMALWVQASMIAHRDVGVALLVCLALYYPLHVLAAHGFSWRNVTRVLRPVRGLLFLLLGYSIVEPAWELHPLAAVALLIAALLVWEFRQPGRALRRRVFDAVGLAVLSAMLANATRDGVIRIFIMVVALYTAARVGSLTAHVIRRRNDEVEPFGHFVLYLSFALFLFAAMMVGGTNAGKYGSSMPVMDDVHYVTGALFVTAVVVHATAARRRMLRRGPDRRFLHIPALFITLALLFGWEVRCVRAMQPYETPILTAGPIAPKPVSAYSALHGYYRQGHDHWFEPRLASCSMSRCHPEPSAQHEISAHGRAMRSEEFKRQLSIFISEKGRAAADYCLGCHAPLGVVTWPGDGSRGRVVDPLTTEEPAFTMGVGCVVCHRAQPIEVAGRKGNAGLAVRPLWMEQERYLGEDTAEGLGIHRTLILAANRLHTRTYHIEKTSWDDVCAACHVVDLPENLSVDGHRRRTADQYTSFAKSPYARAGLTCAACHQQRMETHEIGYNTVAHAYPGSGTSLPYPDAAADSLQRMKSLEFLAGNGDADFVADQAYLPPCIGDIGSFDGRKTSLEKPPPGAAAELGRGNRRRDILSLHVDVIAQAPTSIDLQIKTSNACSGHTFPSGGGIKAFLEILVKDEQGRVVGRYGGLDADGRALPSPTNLGSQAADVDGNPLKDRRFWRAARLLSRRVIDPGETLSDRVQVPLAGGGAPRTLEARWYYLRPELLRALEHGDRQLKPVLIGLYQSRLSGR